MTLPDRQYFHVEYTFWPDPHWSLLILDDTGEPLNTYGPFATRQEAWEHTLALPDGAIRTSWVASW